MSDLTTAVVTLGHDGLTADTVQARFLITDALANAGTILATFFDGVGTWETDDETLLTESCDAWLVSLDVSTVPHLRDLLGAYAATFGQDALGFVVHGLAGEGHPSYVEAP